jgi:hypothetical protein
LSFFMSHDENLTAEHRGDHRGDDLVLVNVRSCQS